jgi:hypothetical protein
VSSDLFLKVTPVTFRAPRLTVQLAKKAVGAFVANVLATDAHIYSIESEESGNKALRTEMCVVGTAPREPTQALLSNIALIHGICVH